MAGGEFHNVKIVGLAGAVPKHIIRNHDWAGVLGEETIERIIRVTGVEQMHKALPEQTAGDLGYVAAADRPHRDRCLDFGNQFPRLYFSCNVICYS